MKNKQNSIPEKNKVLDQAAYLYFNKRVNHWNKISKENPKRFGTFYQNVLKHYYKFHIPEGLNVLEIGCSHGDLLAALKPKLGIGIDFSREMIECAAKKYPHHCFIQADAHTVLFRLKFDVIILSDLVNDLWDVQTVLENIKSMVHPGTRIIFNFFNNLWRIPFSVIRKFGLCAKVLEQNWLSPQDVSNLLEITGFEVIKYIPHILLPVKIPLITGFANKFLVNILPFKWAALTNFMIARPGFAETRNQSPKKPSVSIVIPARNEAGNIETIFKRIPDFGARTELIFIEGGSGDNTFDKIQEMIDKSNDKNCQLLKQSGTGKGNAVRLGFERAGGDILMILDADMTVPPEDLKRFYDIIASGKGEFINGVRLVYPLENQSMRFLNILGNKFFSLLFTWLLGQAIKDTLCGTKVLWRHDYNKIAQNRSYFGDFDPFGDFDLLFGASKLNLQIVELPIRYRSRIYGDTNISRWSHGWLLLKMVVFAARRIKFI